MGYRARGLFIITNELVNGIWIVINILETPSLMMLCLVTGCYSVHQYLHIMKNIQGGDIIEQHNITWFF